MVRWGAYAHATSFEGRMRPSKSSVGGGDRAMAARGNRRIRPPQWLQTRGASAMTGVAFLGGGGGSRALAFSSSPPG